MEKTSINNLAELLPEGCTTVGTHMDVRHLKASPIGATIRCRSILTAIDDRRLSFHIEAYDDSGDKIGESEHERFIVNAERFMNKFKK
jgi:predicted thioesterase